ncbi:unnamed protein product [Amoebophrya sp. A120]|nr:unnamed protein product [Amoebophrya sp. A120]|eukprot:GSA120T00025271001.1
MNKERLLPHIVVPPAHHHKEDEDILQGCAVSTGCSVGNKNFGLITTRTTPDVQRTTSILNREVQLDLLEKSNDSLRTTSSGLAMEMPWTRGASDDTADRRGTNIDQPQKPSRAMREAALLNEFEKELADDVLRSCKSNHYGGNERRTASPSAVVACRNRTAILLPSSCSASDAAGSCGGASSILCNCKGKFLGLGDGEKQEQLGHLQRINGPPGRGSNDNNYRITSPASFSDRDPQRRHYNSSCAGDTTTTPVTVTALSNEAEFPGDRQHSKGSSSSCTGSKSAGDNSSSSSPPLITTRRSATGSAWTRVGRRILQPLTVLAAGTRRTTAGTASRGNKTRGAPAAPTTSGGTVVLLPVSSGSPSAVHGGDEGATSTNAQVNDKDNKSKQGASDDVRGGDALGLATPPEIRTVARATPAHAAATTAPSSTKNRSPTCATPSGAEPTGAKSSSSTTPLASAASSRLLAPLAHQQGLHSPPVGQAPTGNSREGLPADTEGLLGRG